MTALSSSIFHPPLSRSRSHYSHSQSHSQITLPLSTTRCLPTSWTAPFRLLDLPYVIQANLIDIIAANIKATPTTTLRWFRLNPADFPVPVDWSDLHNLALTCRHLHALTAPICQRQLVISSFTPRTSGHGHTLADQCDWVLRRYARRLSNVATLAFLGTVPHIFMHDLDATSRAFRAVSDRIPRLRFLVLSHTHSNLADEMLAAQSPHLVALSLSCLGKAGLTPGPPREPPYAFLARLKAFKMRECPQAWLALIPHMHKLEHLTIWLASNTHQFRDLDWFKPATLLPTLRYLNLDGFKLRPDVLVSLCEMIHAHRTKGLPFVLEELDLEAHFTSTMIDHVLKCLAGHTGLRALALSCIPASDMSPAVTEGIVRAGLVGLRKLLLMVDNYRSVEWPTDLNVYASSLARLPRLEMFFHNHAGGLPANQAALFAQCPALQSHIRVDALWVDKAAGWETRRGPEPGKVFVNAVDLRDRLLPFESRWAV